MMGRLIWIETRRNIAIWLVPVVLLVAWWLLSARGWVPILWRSTNGLLLEPIVPFAAPAIAGAAAWMAGRDHRRGTSDLLTTTPALPMRRALATWSATAIWGVVSCLLFVAFLMSWTGLVATWGGPDLWPVPTILVTIPAFSIWGYAIGTLIPSRFTAPAVALGAFAVVLYLTNATQAVNGGYQTYWVTYLAPDRIQSHWAGWHTLMYVGLTGLGVAALMLTFHRVKVALLMLALSLALTVTGAVMIRAAWQDNAPSVSFVYRGAPPPAPVATKQFTEPQVCQGEPIAVCVHPRYKPLLSDAVEQANELAEPLIGLSGVPTEAGPRDATYTGGASRSFFAIRNNARLDVESFADRLVADEGSINGNLLTNPAQIAIRSWLLERAEITSISRCDDEYAPYADEYRPPGVPSDDACQATARFASLSTSDQRNWLETNYAALRAGDIDLDDLP